MNREKHQAFWIDVADKFAERSTCVRIHAGAIIVKDDRIISAGYNGVPAHREHCVDFFTRHWQYNAQAISWEEYLKSQQFYDEHHEFAIHNEIHDVMNAISFAARHGLSTLNASIYSTHSACSECAKIIIASGIQSFYYRIRYLRDVSGLDLLKESDVVCAQL
jgi:dCMP deaminase